MSLAARPVFLRVPGRRLPSTVLPHGAVEIETAVPPMETRMFQTHETEYGSFISNDRLPLVRLREQRRALVLSLRNYVEGDVPRECIREIAEIEQAIDDLTDGEVVLDGEIVALDRTGRPDFGRLQTRMNLTKPAEIDAAARVTPVHFAAFDLLAVPYTLKKVDYFAGAHKTPEFRAINPCATVPCAVIDESLVLTESNAIIAYAGEQPKTNDSAYPRATQRSAPMY